MRRSEAREPAGRLVVGAPRQNRLVDMGALALFFAAVEPTAKWVLARIDFGRYGDRAVILLLITYALIALAALALLVALRGYRRSQPGKFLILDRRRDTVTLGDRKLCALSEVAGVELRSFGKPEESPSYRVGLVVAGLRSSAAPRPVPSMFDDTIAVNESIDERAMRAYAARIAAFVGVPVEEVGL